MVNCKDRSIMEKKLVKRLILKSRKLLHRRRNRIIRNGVLFLTMLVTAFIFRFSIYTFIVNATHPYPEWVLIDEGYVDMGPFREALEKKLKEKRLVPFGIHSFQGSLHCTEAARINGSYHLIFRVMTPYGSVVTGPPIYYRVSGSDMGKLSFEIRIERYKEDLTKWRPVDHYASTLE